MPDTIIRAGDRAPDAPLVDATKTPVRMFDVFRGPHFTLLTIGAAATPLPERYSSAVKVVGIAGQGGEARENSLVDADGFVDRIYGPGIILVRPDGYVGYAGPQDAPQLNDYLSQFFAQ
jgi:hypothetical protein